MSLLKVTQDRAELINFEVEEIAKQVVQFETPKVRMLNKQENKELVCEITKDPYLLRQYYQIREDLYKSELGLKNFSGQEDHFDLEGDIVVARFGTKVVGGCRINYSLPEDRKFLPLEEAEFNMISIFPDLNLVDKIYCEFSRLVLLSEFRHSDYLKILVFKSISHSILRGSNYLFTVSPLLQSKIYKRILLDIRLNYISKSNCLVPQKNIYEGIKMVLSMTELTPVVETSIDNKILQEAVT